MSPFAKRRIVLDLDRREPDLVLAVAGAPRDDLVAVAERIRQFGIGLAVLGRGVVDIAAIDDLGFARRAKAAAVTPPGSDCRMPISGNSARRRCARNRPASRRRNSRARTSRRLAERSQSFIAAKRQPDQRHASGRAGRTRRTVRRRKSWACAAGASCAATPVPPPRTSATCFARSPVHLRLPTSACTQYSDDVERFIAWRPERQRGHDGTRRAAPVGRTRDRVPVLRDAARSSAAPRPWCRHRRG